jgi:hypothetical protein
MTSPTEETDYTPLEGIKAFSLKGLCSAVSDHVPALHGTRFSNMLVLFDR